MTGIDSYSTTPATNATCDGGSVNWAENQAPSTVNNSERQCLADLRSAFNGLIYFQYGTGDQGAGNLAVPAVYASGTSFTITGADVTTVYEANRRLRAVGGSTGTIYGTISSSSYNGGNTTTTVNVTWDSGSLSNETLVVSLSQIPVTGTPWPATIVTLTGAQTLTNKTITSPSIGGTVAGGATYTSPTLATPTITGTVTGVGGTWTGTHAITLSGATGDVLTLRGGAATRMQLTFGRSAADWTLGIAASGGQYVPGSVAGDLVWVANTQQFIVSTDNGGSASFIVSNTDIFAPNASTTASAANVFMDNAASNKIKRVTSSTRYKADFQPLQKCGAIIDALNPGTYLSLAPDDDKAQRHYGLLAEEVAKVAPELVIFVPEKNAPSASPAYLADNSVSGRIPDYVQYDRFVALLVAEVKSLRSRLTAAGIA